jgi:RING finger protein 114/RING finger protein 166
MPWGDPAYVSRDFVSHLKLRHRFDFDLVGDYALSEEESLRHAIQLSSDELREEDEWLQRVIQISSYEV